jgi:2-polyprenyl-3-methyl-5-hydroxy-6-metoxy-1,4-benzoquinol methylase
MHEHGEHGEHIESNRALWNEWAEINAKSDFYDLESFISGERGIRLRDYEIEEVGDVSGKDLLHIQCHIGTDTLSWARLGANVTGTDFSAAGLAKAKEIAEKIGIEGRWVQSDTYDLPTVLEGQFDIVYMSRGVLGWLPEVKRLAEVVAHFLRPGGIYFLSEIHPVIQVFDETNTEQLVLVWPYWEHDDPIVFETEGSYADREAQVKTTHEFGWNHSLGEIVTAFAEAGLRIENLREYPFVEWPVDFLEEREDQKWYLPSHHKGGLPLFFSLKASKP